MDFPHFLSVSIQQDFPLLFPCTIPERNSCNDTVYV
ncbi:Uncharacterised protein [Mycobacteroides abscessus subsp. abscessus]|nr:Uncharacterised protein [Mycobacteroides abscessus subsp. abscessus]